MLRASGETIEGPRHCDSFDVFVDEAGDLVVLLMDVHASVEPSDSFVASLLCDARSALHAHQPLHTVINALEMQLAARPGEEVALAIVRFSQRDAKVELLNAGMPALANAGPAEHVALHAALSGPVGRRVGEVPSLRAFAIGLGQHLARGLRWHAERFPRPGRRPRDVCQTRASRQWPVVDDSQRGRAVRRLSGSAPGSTRFLRDDATFILVSADPGTRFQSAIVPGLPG